jgi:23S rRNA (adenine2503-C2)-methyltransferase
MSILSDHFRSGRNNLITLHNRFVSTDGTVRYLLRMDDGEFAEAVCIPREDRVTFCISSQVGCGLGCTFCLTGRLGLTRDLSAGEIIDQLRFLLQTSAVDRFSIVFMGMGEPLANYQNVLEAIRYIHDDHGLKMPMSRITVSTAGLVPAMRCLANEPLFPNLSISLTGVTNKTRDALMPINRKYPIEQIMDTVRELPPQRQKRVMFECVMIKDLTDSPEDARELSRLVQGMNVKVNLIPLNPADEIPFERSDDNAILRFQEILIGNGVATFIRKNRGNDVSGACGQLKQKIS